MDESSLGRPGARGWVVTARHACDHLLLQSNAAQVQPRVVGTFYLSKSGAIKCKRYVSKSFILKGSRF